MKCNISERRGVVIILLYELDLSEKMTTSFNSHQTQQREEGVRWVHVHGDGTSPLSFFDEMLNHKP